MTPYHETLTTKDPMYRDVTDIMNDGLVTAFQSMVIRGDFEDAIDFIDVICDEIPPPSLLNDIIFQILMGKCEEKIAYQTRLYVHNVLTLLPSKTSGFKYDHRSSLQDNSGVYPDIFSVFSHLVDSSFAHHEISRKDKGELVDYPNCDILIIIYSEIITKFLSMENDFFEDDAEQRVPIFIGWINDIYKKSETKYCVLKVLHTLLDFMIDTEVLRDKSLTQAQALNQSFLFEIVNNILTYCPDVFTSLKRMEGFFAKTELPYLQVKICLHKIHELIYNKKLLKDSQAPLTLEYIIYNYFFLRGPSVKTTKQPSTPATQTVKGTTKSPKQLRKLFSTENTTGDTVLHELCRKNKYGDLLELLLNDSNLDINETNSAGNTPLHEACLSKSYFGVRFLLIDDDKVLGSRKANCRATNNDGRTPLHCAAHTNDVAIANMLLKEEGSELVKLEDNFGKKPLAYAATKDMQKLLKRFESSIEESENNDPGANLNHLSVPKLKSKEEYTIYLYGLCSILTFYLKNFHLCNIKKRSVDKLSHKDSKCPHFVPAGNSVVCDDDLSKIEILPSIFDTFINGIESDAKQFGVNVRSHSLSFMFKKLL